MKVSEHKFKSRGAADQLLKSTGGEKNRRTDENK